VEPRGKLISFEGGEGTGKSTQARLLRSSLEDKGKRVVLTREPGGSPGAEQIRKLVVEGEPQRWTPLSETLLFLAARADHVARIIEPSLASGMWVVSDRFSDSTYVYQGIARGLGAEKVRRLQEAALGSFAPDLTIVLDLDPAEGLKRAGGRAQGNENRFERFDGNFHEKLRTAFRDIARSEPRRCVVIDAGRTPEAVAADVWRAVQERLKP
jgi:dTMP kinase